MAASPEKDREQNTMEMEEKRQLSPENEERRQLSSEKTEKRQLSPENEERRRLYEDRFFDLVRRYRDFVDRINSCKVLVREKRMKLDIVKLEKRVIAIDWKEASSLCNELQADFPLFARDLRKCMESNMDDCNLFEDISEQDNHQSEEAELMLAEVTDLNTKTLQLSHYEMGAECYVERLLSLIRHLEGKYNEYLVEISEIDKHNQLSYPAKPEFEEDATGHLSKAKDSRARSPPCLLESRM